VTASCLVRWIQKGVRIPGRTSVKLEAARLAGRYLTTPRPSPGSSTPNRDRHRKRPQPRALLDGGSVRPNAPPKNWNGSVSDDLSSKGRCRE